MIKTELQDHQKDAVATCLKMRRHIVAGDTGSGKTLIGLKLIEEIRKTNPCGVALVVCPKTAVENTWEKEIKKHTTRDFTYALHKIDPDKMVNIVSVSQLKNIVPHLRPGQSNNTILIIDECHILKSPDSQQAALLRNYKFGLMNFFPLTYGLTASPAMNHVEDIYFLVNSFFPNFFSSYEDFMNYYAIRIKKYRRVYDRFSHSQKLEPYMEVIGYQNLDHLYEVLKQVMWRHVIDYKVQFFFENIQLNAQEWERYLAAGSGMLREQYFRDFVGRLPDLQQIVNGSIIQEGLFNESIELSSKEKALVRLLTQISDRGEGAVVFTTFRSTIKRFHRLVKYLKFDGYHFMTGDTDNSSRQRIVRKFSPKEVLFATKVGGTSLNLQAVNNVVFFDKPWSVGEIIQNIGRIARMDTTYNDLRAYFLDAEKTIDIYKTAMLSSNLGMVKSIIGGFNFTEMYFNPVRKEQIIQLRKSLLWGTERSKGKTPGIKEKAGDSRINPSPGGNGPEHNHHTDNNNEVMEPEGSIDDEINTPNSEESSSFDDDYDSWVKQNFRV